MDSYRYLNMYLNSKEIGTPKIKRNVIDIDGADGVLDLTGFYGEPKYSNRTLKFDFTIIPSVDKLNQFSVIQHLLHGTKQKIILSDDPDWYYVGVISVDDLKTKDGIATVSIEADCEPFKTAVSETVVSGAVTGSHEFTLVNLRKRVVPKITTDSEFTFTFEGQTYVHDAGTFSLPEIELKDGVNIITATGTGNVSFTFARGRL